MENEKAPFQNYFIRGAITFLCLISRIESEPSGLFYDLVMDNKDVKLCLLPSSGRRMILAPCPAASTTCSSSTLRVISMRAMASSLEQILEEQEVGRTSSCSYTAARNSPGAGRDWQSDGGGETQRRIMKNNISPPHCWASH